MTKKEYDYGINSAEKASYLVIFILIFFSVLSIIRHGGIAPFLETLEGIEWRFRTIIYYIIIPLIGLIFLIYRLFQLINYIYNLIKEYSKEKYENDNREDS